MTAATLPPVSKFAWDRLVDSLDLPATTKAVAVGIQKHANLDGTKAFMGIKCLSRKLSLSPRCVLTHVKRLRDDLGLIQREMKGSTAGRHCWNDEYTLVVPDDIHERVGQLATRKVRLPRRCSLCPEIHHAGGYCKRHYNQKTRPRRCAIPENTAHTRSAHQPVATPVSASGSGGHVHLMRSKPRLTCENKPYQPWYQSFNTGPMDMAPRRAATSGRSEISRHSREEIIDSIRWAVIGTLGADIDALLTDEDIICLWKHKGIKSKHTTDVTSLFRHIFAAGADIGKMLGKARGLYDGQWDEPGVPQAETAR